MENQEFLEIVKEFEQTIGHEMCDKVKEIALMIFNSELSEQEIRELVGDRRENIYEWITSI